MSIPGSRHIHRPKIEPNYTDKVILKKSDWRHLPVKETAEGFRVYFEFPSYTLDAHLTKLPAGGRSHKHRHLDEAIILILKGKGYSVIEGKRVDWEEGDVLFIPKWVWHQHFADSSTDVEYFAVTNQPLLENLGKLNLTEEAEEQLH
jgi:quercetin dioxygenase-like cupin family protein